MNSIEVIARAVHQSFWEMQGGVGDAPDEPSAGDAQVAFDVRRALGDAGFLLFTTIDGATAREWL